MSRPTWRRAALGGSLFLVAMSAPPAARGEDCSGSGFRGHVHTVTPAVAPDLILEARGSAAAAAVEVRDTTAAHPDAPDYVFVRHLGFALQRGELGFDFAPGAYFQCSAGAVVDERFVLEGLPVGTDVGIRLRLDIEVRVDRSVCGSDCELSVYSRIESPAGSDERWRDFLGPAGPSVTTWSREALVPVRGGTEFALRFELSHPSPDGARSVDTSACWSFPDLAPGISVRACLAGDGPTPVRDGSWGALEAHYR